MNEQELNNISNNVKESGIVSINDYLKSNHFLNAKKVLQYISDQKIAKADTLGHFPINFRANIIKLIKLDFNKIYKSMVLKKIAKDLKLKIIAEKIFSHQAELHMIDSYYSKKSDKNIIDWHNDIGFKDLEKNTKKRNLDAMSIKFFFYMTDVESENGSLAYIPYSHHVVKAVTSLIEEKKIDVSVYWRLEDLRSLVLKNPIRDLIIQKIGKERYDIFIENSEFVEEKTKDTRKFDFQMKKGSALIFDEIGVHRGSRPSKQGRLVLRFLYRRKI